MLVRIGRFELEVRLFSLFVRVPKLGEMWLGNGEFVVNRPIG